MVKSGLYLPFTIYHLLKLGRGDLLDDVALDLVAVLDVVEVLQPDAALEALAHLGDVVLEAAKAADAALPGDDAVADEPRARVAADDAVEDAAAGDDARLRHAEGREHESLAQNLLRLDLVEANVHVLLPRQLRRADFRPHVEADDDEGAARGMGLRRGGEQDVRLSD